MLRLTSRSSVAFADAREIYLQAYFDEYFELERDLLFRGRTPDLPVQWMVIDALKAGSTIGFDLAFRMLI